MTDDLEVLTTRNPDKRDPAALRRGGCRHAGNHVLGDLGFDRVILMGIALKVGV
jgi:hypothetical protein